MTLDERIAELEAENVALWEQMTVLADLVGADLSLGTLVAWVNQAVATLEPAEASIKAAVSRAAVPPCCETSVRQAGHLACAYVPARISSPTTPSTPRAAPRRPTTSASYPPTRG
jgi:Transposase IS66 family